MHCSKFRNNSLWSIATRTCWLLLTLLPTASLAWISNSPMKASRFSTQLSYEHDKERHAENFEMSEWDIAVLSALRARHETLPIMVMDRTLLPGQRIEYSSADPRFRKLVEYSLANGVGEIGIIGRNPYTNRPLNMGVTFQLKRHRVKEDLQNNALVIQIQGRRRFDILGHIWEDETDNFHYADVEMLEDKFEPIVEWQYNQTVELADKMVFLVDQWIACALKTGSATSGQVKDLLHDLGAMPSSLADRAIWVAALINPSHPKLPHDFLSVEIRPSMLACKNDHDRMQLAYAAITTSIDQMMERINPF